MSIFVGKLFSMRIVQTKITYFLDRLFIIEHVGMMEEIIEKAKGYIAGMPVLAKEWNRFERLVSHESIMFKVSRKSLETKEMAAYNKERLLYWREMRRRLKFFAATSDEETVRESARRLLSEMKHFHEALTGNLWVKTICINLLLESLSVGENSAAVDAIPDFRKLMEGLGRANGEFEKLHYQRSLELENNKSLGKIALFRRKVDKALIALLNSIVIVYKYNEMDTRNPDVKERLEKTAFEVNSLIEQLKLNLAHHGIRLKPGRKRALNENMNKNAAAGE